MDDTSEPPASPTGPVRPERRWGRRWGWGLLLLAVVIPAARVVWIYRPLNATERRLIGVWKFRVAPPNEPPAEMLVTLTPDRRFMLSDTEEEEGARASPGYGAWSSNGVELGIQEDREPLSWGAVRHMARQLMAGRNPLGGMTSAPIEFQDDDHFRFGPIPHMNGLTADMTRTKTDSESETAELGARP